MEPFNWAILAGAVLVALVIGGAIGWMIVRRRHARTLRDKFGPEYDHAVEKTGSKRRAETELHRREQRVKQFDIHPLTNDQRIGYTESWKKVQANFVDAPVRAVAEADELVTEVMRERGYPMGNFEQRAEDLSVDHPRVVENYRAAHDLALRNDRGEADTEDLRQAMVHYRALFEDLLETPVTDGQMEQPIAERRVR